VSLERLACFRRDAAEAQQREAQEHGANRAHQEEARPYDVEAGAAMNVNLPVFMSRLMSRSATYCAGLK